jgi:hypothetical protein
MSRQMMGSRLTISSGNLAKASYFYEIRYNGTPPAIKGRFQIC